MLREVNQPLGSTGNDELLRVDRAVRKGLTVSNGETILATAKRIIYNSEISVERFSSKKLEAARAIVDAEHAPTARWAAMRHAAAILTAMAVTLATMTMTGCSSSSPVNIVTDNSLHLPAVQNYTFYVDSDVSFQGNLAVNEAAKQWSEFTKIKIIPGNSFFCPIELGCFNIYELPRSELDTLTLDSTYIGYTFLGEIGIAQNMPWDELQDTMIHEWGHAFGLEHHPAPAYAIMNPNYHGAADAIACDDVAQFYALRPELTMEEGATLPCMDFQEALDEALDGGPLLPETGLPPTEAGADASD